MMRLLRIGFIGAGSIVPTHLAALESLGRNEVVAICSRTAERARGVAAERRLAVYTDPQQMLRREKVDAVFVCVPPYAAPGICLLLANGEIPFLVEKPVAALDSKLACQVADEIDKRKLVAAVGYHLRGLDFLDELRREIVLRPPELVVARWMGPTPDSEWWGRREMSGGQVIEQMTHLYDLARKLVSNATVVAASTARGSTTAIVRFDSGPIGAFINTHHAPNTQVELELVPIGTVRLDSAELADGRRLHVRRSPYEVQAEAFLDAVQAGDPSLVLATYRDGLATYLLTRAVVQASGD